MMKNNLVSSSGSTVKGAFVPNKGPSRYLLVLLQSPLLDGILLSVYYIPKHCWKISDRRSVCRR